MKQKLIKYGLLLGLLLCLLLAFCGKDKAATTVDPPAETADPQPGETLASEVFALLMPWEADGAKLPDEYTLAEYEALSPEQRKAFLAYLGPEGYVQWLERAEAEAAKEVELPWDEPGAKQPKDYTWLEYQALTPEQQKAFMEALGPQGLEMWLKQVRGLVTDQGEKDTQNENGSQSGSGYQGEVTIPGENNNPSVGDFYPWEQSDAKAARDYTWEEYDALSSAQKKAFRDHLGKDFENWLKKVLEAEYPWLAEGAKQPKDYTWGEYIGLKDNQKKAFQEFLGASGFAQWQKNALSQDMKNPWDESGAKQPKDYTWAEYTALTDSQQAAFQAHLGNKGMKAWLRTLTDIPWEQPEGKKPEKYTLKEYEKLTAPQQLAFQLHLGFAEFEAWLAAAKNPAVPNPWEVSGAKQPKDYTWAEFCALTADQQMAFQNYLGPEAYEKWLNKVQGQPAPNPWDAPGAKQPKDYTWEDFEALTTTQQIAFQNYLGEDFGNWLKKAQEKPVEKPVVNPWDAPGAKQPKDYTWEEFNALTADQQMAFQNHLGSAGFETWLNNVLEDQTSAPAKNPWDATGAKQPEDYTWEEFNALTAEQQIAFQNHLGPTGFEAWLDNTLEDPIVEPAKNPWDAPGAKQPEDYTWEEFCALTVAQQMAFQKHLGEIGFEAWLNSVLGEPAEEPTEEPTEGPTEESAEESADESTETVGEPAEDPTELTEVSAEAPVDEASESADDPVEEPAE